MKRFVPCALGVLAVAIACGDESKAPGGISVGTSGSGGSPSGSAGTSSKGGSSNAGRAGDSSGNGNGNDTGDGGDEPTGGTAGNGNPPAECGDFWTAEAPEPSVACDLDALVDSGVTLSGDITAARRLESGKSYRLDGPTRVMPGVTLTIDPCVKIIGQTAESVLVVAAGDDGDGNPTTHGRPGPGGKIMAVGEPNAPIIFTSNKQPGQRAPGDWGGVIVLGNGLHNEVAGRINVPRPTIEGLVNPEPYGWTSAEFNAESSGEIAYVRVEYAGRVTSAANETNGLTLGAVGSGTRVDHVMVSNSLDDCFEWFGGAVNADHLIAFNCDDDMFDADRGYSGKVQHLFGRQFPLNAESDPTNGFELDTGNFTPLTTAEWSNVTFCGTRDDLAANPARFGMLLRTKIGGSINNALVTGFDTAGISMRDSSTITITNSLVFGNGGVDDPFGAVDAATPGAAALTWFTEQAGNRAERPDGLCDCWADPPLPAPTSRLQGGAPEGFADPSASYVGAFENASAASNWMAGAWVDWSDR